jgi:adenylate cyclase
MASAVDFAKKAITLDDSEANPHSMLGLLLAMNGDYEKGIVQGERAIELNPNSADAHARLAISLHFSGRWEEAIASFKQALRLNPIPPVYYLAHMSVAYTMAEHYQEALTAGEKAVYLGPDNVMARMFLAAIYVLAGQVGEARVEAAEVIRISPKLSLENASKGWPFKNPADKDRILDALREAGLN